MLEPLVVLVILLLNHIADISLILELTDVFSLVTALIIKDIIVFILQGKLRF